MAPYGALWGSLELYRTFCCTYALSGSLNLFLTLFGPLKRSKAYRFRGQWPLRRFQALSKSFEDFFWHSCALSGSLRRFWCLKALLIALLGASRSLTRFPALSLFFILSGSLTYFLALLRAFRRSLAIHSALWHFFALFEFYWSIIAPTSK